MICCASPLSCRPLPPFVSRPSSTVQMAIYAPSVCSNQFIRTLTARYAEDVTCGTWDRCPSVQFTLASNSRKYVQYLQVVLPKVILLSCRFALNTGWSSLSAFGVGRKKRVLPRLDVSFHQSESKWFKTGRWHSQFVFRSVAKIQRWSISSHFLWH